MCKKGHSCPTPHFSGPRAEPYTPEIAADSICALLLACWPGADFNGSVQSHKSQMGKFLGYYIWLVV